MCCDDDRQAEADYARQEAVGQHHEVIVEVTVKIQTTISLPGSTHTEDELLEAVQEDVGAGEITEVEEL